MLTFLFGFSNNQTHQSNYISIDHIPIAVKNLGNIKNMLSELLCFKVKEGREHAGIKNCFIKFQDGTYLEFITPTDSLQEIGKNYADFLKKRQGGTSFAVSVENSGSLIQYMNVKSISYKIDSNKIWKTIEPKSGGIFFIEYSNKQWKDSKINTTHLNTALSLKSIYFLSNDVLFDLKKYKSFGFSDKGDGIFLNVPYRKLVVGHSNLYLLDESKSIKIKQSLNQSNMTGICGFEIKIKSLSTLNKLIENMPNVTIEKRQTITYLKDINLFFVFTE